MLQIKHKCFIAYRLAQKYFLKLLGRLNVYIQPTQQYCIKKGYCHAKSIEQFDDTINTDQWQREVYELALSLMQHENMQKVIDVGCGSGYKLIHLFGQYDTIGIEIEPTFSWLKKTYPDRKWLSFDEVDGKSIETDLLICSDVIEHVKNPDQLLQFLQSIHFKKLIISTPERDAASGKNDYGPPENTHHYREWNIEEFKKYISDWFTIEDQHIFNDKSITQVIICKK